MELVEPPVTQSSKDDTAVYRQVSRSSYRNDFSDEMHWKGYLHRLPPCLLHSLNPSLPRSYHPTSKPVEAQVQKYLSRFGSDASEVRKIIEMWIFNLSVNFSSKESIAITDDDELLIYWREKSDLFNVLIDEDLEVELIYIPSDRRKSQNKFIEDIKNTTTETIKKAFDEMRRNN